MRSGFGFKYYKKFVTDMKGSNFRKCIGSYFWLYRDKGFILLYIVKPSWKRGGI